MILKRSVVLFSIQRVHLLLILCLPLHKRAMRLCRGGVILYRTLVEAASAVPGAVLHLGGPVHDVAQVP